MKRLGVGLVKGVVVGAAVGAVFQLGLGWGMTPGLLGYLIAMGAAATVGTVGGTPPWHGGWIEVVLKAVFGVGVAALLYWVASRFAAVGIPFALPHADAGTPWTEVPLVYAVAIGGIYGAFLELDNTGEPKRRGGRTRSPAKAAVPDVGGR